jgi:hypothetical protein
MIDSPILDIILSLIFIILLVSIMVTGINELIFTSLKSRNKLLKHAMDHLFFDTNWKEVLKHIKTSPFYKVLQKDSRKLPNYIPASNFSQALIETAIKQLDTHSDEFKNITDPLLKLKKANLANLGEVGDFIYQLAIQSKTYEDLQKKIEGYFNLAMDRVTGIYKRYAKTWSMIVAFGICVFFNIDVIQLTKHFINNPKEADNIAQQAAFVADNGKIDTMYVTMNGETIFVGARVTAQAKANDSAAIDTMNASTNMTLPAKIDTGKTFSNYAVMLQSLPIPLGWKNVSKTICKQANEASGKYKAASWIFVILLWIQKLFGIAATAFAASMGAPFWFDLLQKISPLKKKKNS